MPLSISKLQNLLESKGFLPSKYFIMDGSIFYIEIFSIKTADIFLLYIPSKYEFSIEPGDKVYKISYIDMTLENHTADDYTAGQDKLDIQETYGNMNVNLSPDKDKLVEHLENNYKHPISLDDISKEDTDIIKSIYRQMKRLKYCVQNIKFKLGVMYKNYICCIRRDDTINSFIIKHYPREDCKKLLVIVDLETFYEKNEKLLDDIFTVTISIHKVLEKNQSIHVDVIRKMLDNKKDISVIPLQASAKREHYDSMLDQLRTMLTTMNTSSQKIIEELYDINKAQPTGLQSDITRAHTKSRLEKELDRINIIKGQITTVMVIIKNKKENAILNIDKLMFDNNIMFDTIIKNFGALKEYC